MPKVKVIKSDNLDDALKKVDKIIKKETKKKIKKDLEKDVEKELSALVSDAEYKCLRKKARAALKEFKAKPYSDQVDEFMDLCLLYVLFKRATVELKKDDTDVLDTHVGKSIMKSVKIAIALKNHQEKRKNKKD